MSQKFCIKFEIEILSCGKKVIIVVEPNTTVNSVTLASNDSLIVSWDTFVVLDSILPDEAWVSVKLEAEDEGVGEGAGDGDVGSIPCEVWVTCGGESGALHVDTGLVVRKELTCELCYEELELEGDRQVSVVIQVPG